MNKDDSKTYLNNDLINEIISLIKNDDLELAQNRIESLQHEFPLSDVVLNLKGTIYFKKKEYEKSKIFFERDIVFNP